MTQTSPKRTIIRGDSDKFKITFTKKVKIENSDEYNRIPIDITDWDIKFTVRATVPTTGTLDDKDAIISQQAKILDGAKGIALVYVQSTKDIEPGTYYYDIQCIKPEDEFGFRQISSTRKGEYIVLGDITKDEDGVADDGMD